MSEDYFESFFKEQCRFAWEDAQKGELTHPWVYVLVPGKEPGKKETVVLSLVTDKEAWRFSVFALVRMLRAEAYVVVIEMLFSHNIEIIKKGGQARDDPNAEEVVWVFGYCKDGREMKDYCHVDKDRKMHPEIRPISPEGMIFTAIGNVFDLKKQLQQEKEIFEKAEKFMEDKK
jgi:hypothetical protein